MLLAVDLWAVQLYGVVDLVGMMYWVSLMGLGCVGALLGSVLACRRVWPVLVASAVLAMLVLQASFVVMAEVNGTASVGSLPGFAIVVGLLILLLVECPLGVGALLGHVVATVREKRATRRAEVAG
jgi:hypothetical protein